MSLLSVHNTSYDELAVQVFSNLDVRDTTRYEYGKRIKHFLAYVEQQGSLQLNTLLDYKRSLAANEQYSISYKNKNLACAKIFLRECYRVGLLPRDITTNVKSFQQDHKHKKFGLNDYEVAKVKQWLMYNPQRYREHALLCLLLFNGLREAEICNIKVEDVRLAEKSLFLLGKGRDDMERIHLHPATLTALHKHLVQCSLSDSDYVFTSNRAQGVHGKLTERGLRFIIKAIFAELEIEKNVHGCRHYFATKLIQTMPGELLTVAKFTRHRSTQMLEVYNDSLLMEQDTERFDMAFGTLV
jgi:site-specific recombinase XerD